MDESAREKWEFPLPVGEIQTAVANRLVYHRERLQWWQEEFDKAEAKLKAEGLTFRNYDHTGGRGVEAVVDRSLSDQVGRCQHSIKAHQNKIAEYEAYAFGLSRKQPGELLPMTPNDLRWAGFVGGTSEEDDDA